MTEVGRPEIPICLSCGKKERKNNLGRPPQTRKPVCPRVRVIKFNCYHSVKDVNKSKVFMFDQTATKELKTLTPTRAVRSVIGQGQVKRGLFQGLRFWRVTLSPPSRGEDVIGTGGSSTRYIWSGCFI